MMSYDPDQFILHATNLLHSSLDPSVSVKNFFEYCRSVIPLKELALYSSPQNNIYTVEMAYVTPSRSEFPYKQYFFSEQGRQLIEEMIALGYGVTVTGFLVEDESHIAARFTRSYGIDVEKHHSHVPFYWVAVGGDASIVGTALFSVGEGFSEEHMRLLDKLELPLRFSLMNMRQYWELNTIKQRIQQDNRRLRSRLRGTERITVAGENGGLANVMATARMVAPVDVPVLITGETGSGKEIIAKSIHSMSPRKGVKLVTVNCGAIPVELIDSELFGHVRGAFTNAFSDHKGFFEQAEGGTLFLDEIGELPLSAQTRLLRVLESGEIRRVGDSKDIAVNVRVIAATNRNLQQMTERKEFREDLYYRLSVINIQIPPLRKRKQDIPELVSFFVSNASAKYGVAEPLIPAEDLQRIIDYDWPGNVRQLKNVLESAVIVGSGRKFALRLPEDVDEGPAFAAAENAQGPSGQEQADRPADFGRLFEERLLGMSFDELQSLYLKACLKAANGRVEGPKGAARKTGLPPGNLRAKCRRLGISPRSFMSGMKP